MSSTTFTVPKGVKKIDAFCVGGGGGSGMFGLTPTSVSGGGTSSVGSICSAAGGKAVNIDIHNSAEDINGTDGGSGGGGGGMHGVYPGTGGAGGTDGRNGVSVAGYINNGNVWWATTGGKGQGTTTRYFGESNGTLYASGGSGGIGGASTGGISGGGAAGGYASGITGGGGGGYTTTKLGASVNPGQQIPVIVGNGSISVYTNFSNTPPTTSKDCGSSGICIIRWGKQ